MAPRRPGAPNGPDGPSGTWARSARLESASLLLAALLTASAYAWMISVSAPLDGGREIIALQCTASVGEAQRIIGRWQAAGLMPVVTRAMHIDYLFMSGYTLLLWLACRRAGRALRRGRRGNWVELPARFMPGLALAAGLSDLVENLLHEYVFAHGIDALPIAAASTFASVKWALVALTIAYLVVALLAATLARYASGRGDL